MTIDWEFTLRDWEFTLRSKVIRFVHTDFYCAPNSGKKYFVLQVMSIMPQQLQSMTILTICLKAVNVSSSVLRFCTITAKIDEDCKECWIERVFKDGRRKNDGSNLNRMFLIDMLVSSVSAFHTEWPGCCLEAATTSKANHSYDDFTSFLTITWFLQLISHFVREWTCRACSWKMQS